MAILDEFGKPVTAIVKRRNVRAGYDSAETTPENSRHWAKADKLTSDAWATPYRRAIIRSRMRYERQNNCYLDGGIETHVDYVVGTGPRLQFLGEDDATNQAVEERFIEFAESIGLTDKLALAESEVVGGGGESFLVFVPNDALRKTDAFGRDIPTIAIDLRQYEADQIETPVLMLPSDNQVSGIKFDSDGNPIEYHVLKRHPGSAVSSFMLDYEKIPASDVIHFFRQKRPGQRRGLPEMTPALPLGSQLRRLTLATLMSAELQALLTGTVETTAAPEDGEESDGLIAGSEVPIERGTWPVLPYGHKATAFTSTQPTSEYRPFKRELISEMFVCIGMPLRLAIGNSEGLNYSSGRLDDQKYVKSIKRRRKRIERVILDRVFVRWFELAILVEGYLPQPARMLGFKTKHRWAWDGFPHVDRAKEANADEINFGLGRTTFADLCNEDGTDWIEQKRQKARELVADKQLESQYGIVMPTPAKAVPVQQNSNQNQEDQGNQDGQANE